MKKENTLNTEILWSDRKRWTLFGLPFSFTTYLLTSDRFFVERGLFTTTEDEVRLYRIMDVSLRCTLFQKLFGLGTISCHSSDRTLRDFEIKNVKNPRDVKEMLSDLIEKERVAKRVSNREFIADTCDDDEDDDI